MRPIGRITFSSVLVTACLFTPSASAQVSQAEKLGIQAGAMEYCRDNFSADGKTRKQYDALRQAFIQDLDQMPREEKQRAMQIAGTVGKKGNVGGKKLSSSRCEQMRRSALMKQQPRP